MVGVKFDTAASYRTTCSAPPQHRRCSVVFVFVHSYLLVLLVLGHLVDDGHSLLLELREAVLAHDNRGHGVVKGSPDGLGTGGDGGGDTVGALGGLLDQSLELLGGEGGIEEVG